MRRILQKTPGRTEPVNESLAVLKDILAEVDGGRQPYSAHSYLPAYLIEDAKHAIAHDEREVK